MLNDSCRQPAFDGKSRRPELILAPARLPMARLLALRSAMWQKSAAPDGAATRLS